MQKKKYLTTPLKLLVNRWYNFVIINFEGWIMQMNGFLYITRRWEEDKGRLSRTLDYLVALQRRTQLLIFPEGTDLTTSSKEKSDRYATKNGLPMYYHTLHPKTTGFSYLASYLKRASYLDAVYDLTIAYPDYVPQSEIDLITGKLPNEVHFNIKRISSDDLPEDETSLRDWLEERWYHKEETLKRFAEKNTFSGEKEAWPMASILPLRAAFGFWSLLTGKYYNSYLTGQTELGRSKKQLFRIFFGHTLK